VGRGSRLLALDPSAAALPDDSPGPDRAREFPTEREESMNPTPDTTNTTESEEAGRIRTLERQIGGLRSALDEARHSADVAQEQERRALYRLEGLVRALDLVARRLDEAEREHDETISELRHSEELVSERSARVESLERFVELLEEAAAGDGVQARALVDRLAAVEAERDEARAETAGRLLEIGSLRSRLESAQIQIRELEAVRLGRLSRIHELEAELESTRVELDVARGEVEPAEPVEELLETISRYAEELLELREKVRTLEGRLRERELEDEEPF